MEVRNGSPLYYIWADDIRVASFDGTDLSFFHQDHLGGTAVSTDDTATTVNIDDYYPYGSSLLSYSGSSELHHSFSDKEFDDDISLYYFEARWYDSNIGKFSSLDPAQYDGRAFKMLQDPQSFNAYAYARNNPVAMIDPDGEFWKFVIKKIIQYLMGGVDALTADIPSAGEDENGEFSTSNSGDMMIDDIAISQVKANLPKPIKYGISGAGWVIGQFSFEELTYEEISNEYIYEVSAGDTLYSLFGDAYEEIAEYNNIEDPNLINVGQEIRIPIEEETE